MTSYLHRRSFLKGIATAAAGAAAGYPAVSLAKNTAIPQRLFRVPRILRQSDDPSRVAVIKGSDRLENMLEALDLIKDDIRAGIGDKQVVIKVNFTGSRLEAGTRVDAIRAICETITPFYKKKIIVTEGQGGDNPIENDWMNFEYYALEDEFNVELRDEWDEPFSPLTIVGPRWETVPVNVCETWRDPNTYLISAAVLKRHKSAVVTLSLKNILMASVWNHNGLNQRRLMHVFGQDRNNPLMAQQFTMNQFLVGQHTAPDLAVIDGFMGMERQEVSGDPVDHGVAIAGADFLAADTIGSLLMDVDLQYVGTLHHCYNAGMGEMDPQKIDVLGHAVADCRKTYAEDDDDYTQLMKHNWRLQ